MRGCGAGKQITSAKQARECAGSERMDPHLGPLPWWTGGNPPLGEGVGGGEPFQSLLLWVFGGNSLSGVGCGGFKSCRNHMGLLRWSSYSLAVSLPVLVAVLL